MRRSPWHHCADARPRARPRRPPSRGSRSAGFTSRRRRQLPIEPVPLGRKLLRSAEQYHFQRSSRSSIEIACRRRSRRSRSCLFPIPSSRRLQARAPPRPWPRSTTRCPSRCSSSCSRSSTRKLQRTARRPSSTSRRRGPRSFGGSLRTSCCRRPPRSSTARSKAPPSSSPTLGAAGRTVAATRRQRCSLCPTSRATGRAPVVLFNQSLGDAGTLEPRLPQQVTLCEPQAGRLLVYRADELRAGTLQSDQPRLLIRLWQQPPQPSLPSAADAVIEGLLRHVRAEAPPLLEAARQWPVELATLPVSSSFAQDEASWSNRKLPLRVATHGGRASPCRGTTSRRAATRSRPGSGASSTPPRHRRSPAVRSRGGPIPPGWATLNSD